MDSDTKGMEEKIKKIDMNSPTSVLAQNAVLLPSGVVRVKQSESIQKQKDVAIKPTSSGSATGEHCKIFQFYVFCENLLWQNNFI